MQESIPQKSTFEIVNEETTIADEIAKRITDSLPDHNKSARRDSDGNFDQEDGSKFNENME